MDHDYDAFRSARWHAQHPNRSERFPLCGTVGEDGRPTHRVSKLLPVTCKRCLKLKAGIEFAEKLGVKA